VSTDEPFLPVIGDVYEVHRDVRAGAALDKKEWRRAVVVEVPEAGGMIGIVTRTTTKAKPGVHSGKDAASGLTKEGRFDRPGWVQAVHWNPRTVRRVGKLDEALFAKIKERFV
jgi:hypothetical protein